VKAALDVFQRLPRLALAVARSKSVDEIFLPPVAHRKIAGAPDPPCGVGVVAFV